MTIAINGIAHVYLTAAEAGSKSTTCPAQVI